MASLVAHSHDLLARLRFSGAADAKSLEQPFLASSYKARVMLDPGSSVPYFAILDTQNGVDKPSAIPQVSSKRAHPGVLHPI
jgi:hypothetical protein